MKKLASVRRVIAILIVVLLAFHNGTFAQEMKDSFSVDIEIRPRFELRNGFKKPIEENNDPAAFIEQRNRLYMNYLNDRIEVRLTLQDIRIWGGSNQIYKNDPALVNMYEAWAKYSFSDKSAVKVGRQALNYDNARFLGNLGWAQQGRSHDAAVFQFTNRDKGMKIHLGAAWNDDVPFEPGYLTDAPYQRNNYKTMQFLWANKTYESASISALFFNSGFESQANSKIYYKPTTGIVGSYAVSETLKLNAEAYYQFGKDTGKNDVNAWFAGAELMYISPDIKKNYRASFGVDIASGNEIGETDNTSWNPHFGTNHKFYGFMDYFYVGNAHVAPGGQYSAGLIDIYQKASIGLAKGTMQIHLHQFLSPTDLEDLSGNEYDSYLGTEVDLVYSVKPVKDVTFMLGYSHMFYTDSMEILKNSQNPASIANWSWVMLQIKPTIFSR